MATVPNSQHSFFPALRRGDPPVPTQRERRRDAFSVTADKDALLNEAARIRDSQDEDALHETLDELIEMLREVRLEASSDAWQEWTAACRQHELLNLLHEDPFTCRSYRKPRGYAGDAELLDYIYGVEELWPCPPASDLGQRLFAYTTHSPAPEGVRVRRAFIARVIDRMAEDAAHPHVLSIAAGHLREALLSAAIKRRQLGRLVALDSDPLSMDLVARAYDHLGVEAHAASIRKLFTNRLDLGRFDLVYSTGLFDYLQASSSRRLVSVMFNMLQSGGRLLVANFLPGIRDIGYMEVFMDWHLIYRTRADMMEMTMEIPQEEIRAIRVFAEENQNIIFLEVVKK